MSQTITTITDLAATLDTVEFLAAYLRDNSDLADATAALCVLASDGRTEDVAFLEAAVALAY